MLENKDDGLLAPDPDPCQNILWICNTAMNTEYFYLFRGWHTRAVLNQGVTHPGSQCFGSAPGSRWIRIQIAAWIRIQQVKCVHSFHDFHLFYIN